MLSTTLIRLLEDTLAEGISDAKVNLLARQFRMDPDRIRMAADADPTPNGKYSQWIVRQLASNNIRLPEDGDKVRTRLAQLARLANVSTFTGEKDVGRYPTYAALATAMDAASGTVGKKEQVRAAATEGTKLLGSKGDLNLYLVTTPEAAAKLFRNTEWCVKDPFYFNQYGPPFHYLEKEGEPYKLLHVGDASCMDVMDEPTSPDEFAKFGVKVPVSLLVGDALKSNKRLPPDMEAKAFEVPDPSQEDEWERDGSASKLVNYIRKFVKPGDTSPWFLPISLAIPEIGILYANAALSAGKNQIQRWPEFEEKLLADASSSRSLTNDWAELPWNQDALANLSNYAARLGERWPEAEPYLLQDIDRAIRYWTPHRDERWPELEEEILDVVRHGKYLSTGDGLQHNGRGFSYHELSRYLESAFAQGEERWPELEDAIENNTNALTLVPIYTSAVLGEAGWPEMERSIALLLQPRDLGQYLSTTRRRFPREIELEMLKNFGNAHRIQDYARRFSLRDEAGIRRDLGV